MASSDAEDVDERLRTSLTLDVSIQGSSETDATAAARAPPGQALSQVSEPPERKPLAATEPGVSMAVRRPIVNTNRFRRKAVAVTVSTDEPSAAIRELFSAAESSSGKKSVADGNSQVTIPSFPLLDDPDTGPHRAGRVSRFTNLAAQSARQQEASQTADDADSDSSNGSYGSVEC